MSESTLRSCTSSTKTWVMLDRSGSPCSIRSSTPNSTREVEGREEKIADVSVMMLDDDEEGESEGDDE